MNKKEIELGLAVGYAALCIGILIGSQLVKKQHKIDAVESESFRRRGEEMMKKWEADRLAAEEQFSNMLADKIVEKLKGDDVPTI